MKAAAVMVAIAAVAGVLLFVGFWLLYDATNSNPCSPFWGGITGTVEYQGHTFECWHGEIVGMR